MGALPTINEHPARTYPPRTRENAQRADLTVAFAVDFNSAGERLTRKAAGDKYLAIALETPAVVAARVLYRTLRERNARALNIAGNAIVTLEKHGWTQARANRHLFETLKLCHEHWPIHSIRSGGQTGIDLAGLIAGHALGIEVAALLPKGFIQRHPDNVDRAHTQADVLAQIEEGVEALLQAREAPPPQTAQETARGSVRVVSKRAGGVKPERHETVIDADRTNPVLGNPFHLKDWKDPVARQAVIDRYAEEVLKPDLARQGPITVVLNALRSRVAAGEHLALACWCAPLPCHCDHLKEYIETAGN